MNTTQIDQVRQIQDNIDQERDALDQAGARVGKAKYARGGVGSGHQPCNTDIPPS